MDEDDQQRWVRTRLFDYPSWVPQFDGSNSVQGTGYLCWEERMNEDQGDDEDR